MSPQATAKGTFLSVGIGLMSAGSAAAIVALNPFNFTILIAGIGLMAVGVGLIFLREWVKEN